MRDTAERAARRVAKFVARCWGALRVDVRGVRPVPHDDGPAFVVRCVYGLFAADVQTVRGRVVSMVTFDPTREAPEWPVPGTVQEEADDGR